MSKDLPIFVEDLPLFVETCFFDGKPVGEFKREPAVFFCCHVGCAVSCTHFLFTSLIHLLFSVC